MEDDRTIILNFLNQYEDFTSGDRESGYSKVYRPSWHPWPVQFWFNPPFDEKGKSAPTPSNTVAMTPDGKIVVEDFRTGVFYNLDECLGHSIENFAIAIEDYTP
jgi:outer membrane protein assembly factor BamB